MELEVIITDVSGFLGPFVQVLWANPLKNWIAILSAFLELRISSIPNGIVVTLAMLTITAGWESGPDICVFSTPIKLSTFLRVVDFPM